MPQVAFSQRLEFFLQIFVVVYICVLGEKLQITNVCFSEERKETKKKIRSYWVVISSNGIYA